jgi:hypothetical protein
LKSSFAFLLFVCTLSVQAKVLFVFYDAGETYALKPVLEKLTVPYKVLVMGTSRTLFSGEKYILDIHKNCKTSVVIPREGWPRERALSEADLSKIVACYEPKVIVTGAVSKAQYQIASRFKNLSKPVVSYVDAFTKIDKKSIVQSFIQISDHIIVPTDVAKESLGGADNIHVLGQPSLEKWAQLKISEDKKTKLKKKLGESGKRVLFVGSYGKGYGELFKNFLEASKESPFDISISLHPKSSGDLEKRLIKEANSKVKVLSKFVPTSEWAQVADLVVCYRSTVCFQALNIPKQVAFYELESSSYRNFLLDQKVAQRLTKKDFGQALKLRKHKNKKLFVSGASDKIALFITEIVQPL